MEYILIQHKGEFILEKFRPKDNFDELNKKLLETYGHVNYFYLKDMYDGALNPYLHIKQIINGSIKYMLQWDSSLLYMKIKYPLFYDVIKQKFYNEIERVFDDVENLLLTNPKTIDLVNNCQHYDLQLLQDLTDNDPTQNKKYFKWLCKLFVNNPNRLYEDGNKILELLKDFDNINIKNLMKNNGYSIDIMSYKSDNELYEIINRFKEEDNINESKTEIYNRCRVFESEKFSIYEINEFEESVRIGKGTYWCTSYDDSKAKKNFDEYTLNGSIPLYIIINNISGEKYQISLPHNVFLNGNDDEFNWFKLPDEVWLFLNDKLLQYPEINYTKLLIFIQDNIINRPKYLNYTVEGINNKVFENTCRIVANKYLDWCNVEKGTIGGIINDFDRINGNVWLDYDTKFNCGFSNNSYISGNNITIINTKLNVIQLRIDEVNNLKIIDSHFNCLELFIQYSNNIYLSNVNFDDKNRFALHTCNNIFMNGILFENNYLKLNNVDYFYIEHSDDNLEFTNIDSNQLIKHNNKLPFTVEKFNKYTGNIFNI